MTSDRAEEGRLTLTMEVRVPVGRNFSAVTRIPAAAQQAMNSSSLVIRVHQSTYPQMTNPKAG